MKKIFFGFVFGFLYLPFAFGSVDPVSVSMWNLRTFELEKPDGSSFDCTYSEVETLNQHGMTNLRSGFRAAAESQKPDSKMVYQLRGGVLGGNACVGSGETVLQIELSTPIVKDGLIFLTATITMFDAPKSSEFVNKTAEQSYDRAKAWQSLFQFSPLTEYKSGNYHHVIFGKPLWMTAHKIVCRRFAHFKLWKDSGFRTIECSAPDGPDRLDVKLSYTIDN